MELKIIGYIVAIIGLAVAVLSFQAPKIAFLAGIQTYIILLAGIVVLIVGIALTMWNTPSSSKIKYAAEEVPIYEGVGKHRKIVGYRKAEK